MTFPSVVARATLVSSTSNSTSWNTSSATLGGSAGDLLLAIISADSNPTLTAVSNAPFGADWTKLGQASSGSTVTGAVFYKVAGTATWGSPADALTISSSSAEQYSGVFLRLSGSNLQLQGAASDGSSGNSDPPDLALTDGLAHDALWIASRSGDSTAVASAAPSGYANLQTRPAGGSTGASTNTAERNLNASAEDPGNFTSTFEQWACWTLAIYEGSPGYVYVGNSEWAASYKGVRSDAAL
jgi:hypothetical protein